MKKFVLGIAGHIGSGKSLAGRYFEERGAKFIDADEVVNDLYEPGREGYLKIVNYFGKEFVTRKGILNRKKLAKFVFGDPNKLKILNFLIHPLVTSEIQKLIDQASEIIVAVEATYFEKKHLGSLVDAILWIECDRKTLLRRASKKSGMTEEIFQKILRMQSKPDQIDFAVTNNGTQSELFLQLIKVWDEIAN